MPPPPPWTLFNWGSRGPWYTTGIAGIYMSHIFSPNGVRIVLQGHAQEGQELLHVFHCTVATGPPSAADCIAINDVIYQWWSAVYKNMVSSTCEADQVISTGMNAVPAAQDSRAIGILGVRSGQPVTASVTLALKAATQVSGRRARGRNYMWPMVETDLLLPDAERVTDTYRTAANATFNALISRMSTASYPLCIWSEADVAMHPIHHYIAVDDYVDSQRRRLLGRGR